MTAVDCAAASPTLTIANRDGAMVVDLAGSAAQSRGPMEVEDYVELDGENQNEQIFDATDLTITRNGHRIR